MILSRRCHIQAVAAIVIGTALFAAGSGRAATLITNTFTSVRLSSSQDIDVTGPNVLDWAYFNKEKNFNSDPTIDNEKAVSGVGTVTVTKGLLGNPTLSAIERFTMTFDDGTGPVASNNVPIGANFGAWAGDEDNAATVTFNNVGAGTRIVRVYVGHGSSDRIFDMDYSVTASDGNFSGNTLSNATSGEGDLHATYEIIFTTTDASADLTLQFNSNSGGGANGWIGGYVVEAIPPPAQSAASAIYIK